MAAEMRLMGSTVDAELAQRIVDVLETEAASGRMVDANLLTWADDQIAVEVRGQWHTRRVRRWYEVTIREVER